MFQDPTFYTVAIPAVILVGLTKGGMGEALALIGVPLLALVTDPVRAAAIMLPILIVMDLVALYMWRRESDVRTIKLMLPGALAGIAIGWLTSAWMPTSVLRLIIGTIAITFAGRYFYNRYYRALGEQPGRPHDPVRASFWATLAGYGSFVAHSGGAPYQVYTLPLKLSPAVYTGTGVRFFAILNAVKLIPYFALGQLDSANLMTSLTLFPFVPLATIAGAMIVRRMKVEIFYPYMFGMAGLAGLKLTWDGLSPLLAGF